MEDETDEQLNLPDPEDSEAEELAKKQHELVRAVSAARLDTLQQRVAWILNYHPDARDSDIALYSRYWKQFEGKHVSGNSISLDAMYHLTRPMSLTRARARVQNEYRLFQASTAVRQRRGTLSEEERERAIQDEAPPPVYTVYTDESGKTNDYLVVGAVWFLDGWEIVQVDRAVSALAGEAGQKSELHFKEIDWGSLDFYTKVADDVLGRASTISFTSISVDRRGHKHIDQALTEMRRHLLVRGVEHLDDSGRAPLPRTISVFKDAEEVGRDKLLMAELGEHLQTVSATRLDEGLQVGRMAAVPSDDNVPVQIADLWTSSISRVLNATGKRNSARDRFADYLLAKLGIPAGPVDAETTEGDVAVHVSLGT